MYVYINIYTHACIHTVRCTCMRNSLQHLSHADHCRAQNLRPAPIKLWLVAAVSHQHRFVSLEL